MCLCLCYSKNNYFVCLSKHLLPHLHLLSLDIHGAPANNATFRVETQHTMYEFAFTEVKGFGGEMMSLEFASDTTELFRECELLCALSAGDDARSCGDDEATESDGVEMGREAGVAMADEDVLFTNGVPLTGGGVFNGRLDEAAELLLTIGKCVGASVAAGVSVAEAACAGAGDGEGLTMGMDSCTGGGNVAKAPLGSGGVRVAEAACVGAGDSEGLVTGTNS